MVRFINKDLKAHSYVKEEKVSQVIPDRIFSDIADLLKFHLKDFGNKSPSELIHLLKKTTILLSLESPRELDYWICKDNRSIKDFFLLIELILESYIKNKYSLTENYILDFIQDVNEFFLIHGVPLQIRYFLNKNEFYIEKIISEEVSNKIMKTLSNFSKETKVFEDFKTSIKRFSIGDHEGAIESCCVAIEDYLCILLKKDTCQSIDIYYKGVAKKLKIPSDLNDRFTNLINYIHKHRSPQNHGALEKKEVEDLELVSETIIQFTMAILNYLKKKSEKL